jgi:MFS family permease
VPRAKGEGRVRVLRRIFFGQIMKKRIQNFSRQTFASLKIYNYRLYFIGQAISLCGTWMQTIGQAWLVLKLTNSGTQLGLIVAAQFLPMLFLAPLGGILADRFSKRKILYFTQSISALLALALGILVISQTAQLWMVYVLAVALGLVNTADNPARQTFIFEMVGKKSLPNAISLNSTMVNLARVIGPAIAGGIIASLGLAPCFFLNAVSFIAVLIALRMMRAGELSPAPKAGRAKGQLAEGWRYIKSNKILRDTLLMMAIIGTLTYEFSVILPLVAQFTFHGGAGTYAALTVAMGLGSMAGGLWTASRKTNPAGALVKAALWFGITVLLAAVLPSLILVLIALVAVGFYSINFLALGNSTLQLESKAEMRGRVMSFWTMAFLGSTPIGGPIIGYIGDHANPRWGLAVGGLAAVFAAALGYWLLRRDSRKMSTAM